MLGLADSRLIRTAAIYSGRMLEGSVVSWFSLNTRRLNEIVRVLRSYLAHRGTTALYCDPF
jgi:hypothetical protein